MPTPVTALSIFALISGAAAQPTLIFDCRYNLTVDTATRRSEVTSGQFSAVVRFSEAASERGTISIETTKSGPCHMFAGVTSSVELSGHCTIELSLSGASAMLERTLVISRRNGSFEEHVTMSGRATLIHYGVCSTVQTQF